MSAPALTDSRDRLSTALAEVRKSRHHPDCRCFLYRDHKNAPFCTRQESSWSQMVDRIITSVLRESF